MKRPATMINFVSLCIQVAILLLAFAFFVDAGPYFGFCKETCEKHRTTDSAYTLNCDDHRDDGDCRRHCWYCKDDICDDNKKVYSCPAKPREPGPGPGGPGGPDYSHGPRSAAENVAALSLAIYIAIVFVVISRYCDWNIPFWKAEKKDSHWRTKRGRSTSISSDVTTKACVTQPN